MGFRDEVLVGDRLQVAWRDIRLPVMHGVVVAIDRADVGQAYVVVPDGEQLSIGGAVHVSEFAAILAVWRTECWLMLPLPFSRAVLEAKTQRMNANERKRLERKVPLLAPVFNVRVLDVDQVEIRSRTSDEEYYEWQRANVEKCLALRARAEALLPVDEFAAVLLKNSTGFLASGDVTRRLTLWVGVVAEGESRSRAEVAA